MTISDTTISGYALQGLVYIQSQMKSSISFTTLSVFFFSFVGFILDNQRAF